MKRDDIGQGGHIIDEKTRASFVFIELPLSPRLRAGLPTPGPREAAREICSSSDFSVLS